jgi:hypothetical protein
MLAQVTAMQGENPARRKIKVSWVMVIVEGLVGPKGMTKVALDGQWVNIPTLHIYSMEGRRVVAYASIIGFGDISRTTC